MNEKPVIQTIRWDNDAVIMLDQRKLPTHEVYVTCADYKAVANAIEQMVIRGAPAIGVAAAMGMALGAMAIAVTHYAEFIERLQRVGNTLSATRPTAVNLQWGVNRMLRLAESRKGQPLAHIIAALREEAMLVYREDLETNLRIGENGAQFFQDGDVVLTHCNAGELATAGHGTALSPIYHCYHRGMQLAMYVDETRPLLQGARLTAWELQRHGVMTTVITDSMAGWFMQQGKITKVIVGADRIAASGDVANKIGTYTVAVLAKAHHIPFYVAAPWSTVDVGTPTGRDIPIEERSPREVSFIGDTQLTPRNTPIANPAFDVTPAQYVTAIITDRGVFPPNQLAHQHG